MHFFTNYYRTAYRLVSHRMVWAVAFVALNMGLGTGIFGTGLQAAGCAHRTENASIGLDPFGNPLASNILKVYSGGEFHYYVLPQGKPCNGPNCKGAPPSEMTSVPPVITSERCDLTFLSNALSVSRSHYDCDRFVFWPTTRPTSPVLDGLLRPPTV